MKKEILVFILYLVGHIGLAQDKSSDFIARINKNKYDVGETLNHPKTLFQLEIMANNSDNNSLNWLGILYNEGLGVTKNENTAFELIQKAAQQDNLSAQYNLGRFYMTGIGCDIDFDQAKYWFETASNNGNERAAYVLGYMAMKGFGVPQDYKKAVSWFMLSSFPMAKHWLGVCYYFGYGVPKDEDKAILCFSKSKTPNSDMMLKHIAENVKQTVDSDIAQEINEKETPANTAIDKETLEKTIDTTLVIETITSPKELKPKYFDGKWKGKLIELDWSGKEIVRVLPLSWEFTAQENVLDYKWELDGKTTQNTTILEDNSLYFENLNMTFDMPYSHNPDSNTLDWQVLSSQMEFKTINKKTYLTANLETFSPELREPGPPMRLVLKQIEEGEEDLTAEELLAISAQKAQFIVLYPNPFVSDVLIAYELETDAQVSVNIYDFTGNSTPISLQTSTAQTAGKHHYTLEGENLHPGMYIVRVTVGDQVHSRILIKQ